MIHVKSWGRLFMEKKNESIAISLIALIIGINRHIAAAIIYVNKTVLFNIDKDNIDIESSEQKIRDKMAEITQLISSFTLWWNPDETVNQTGMEQAPTLPQTSTSWEETTPTVQAPSDPLQSYVQSGGQTNTQ